MGELQELQPRCHCVCRYSCPCGGSVPLPKTINFQSIGGGFAEGLSNAETQQLEDEVEDTSKKLPGDIDLFGETDGENGAW